MLLCQTKLLQLSPQKIYFANLHHSKFPDYDAGPCGKRWNVTSEHHLCSCLSVPPLIQSLYQNRKQCLVRKTATDHPYWAQTRKGHTNIPTAVSKSNLILFVTYTWLADVNASAAKCLCF